MSNFNLLSKRLEWCIAEKQHRDNRRIYGAELASVADVSRAAVSNWMKDVNGISANQARLLGEFFNVDPIWLETGEGKPDVKKTKHIASEEIDLDDGTDQIAIRQVEFRLSAGMSGYSVEFVDGEKSPISFRKDWYDSRGYNPSKLVAIKVKGQSMETSLFEDDIVVVNTADTKHVDTEVFAFNYDGEPVIKRLSKEQGNWYLTSDNPDKRKYPNKMCDENCFVIGRIVYKQSERI